MRAFNLMQPGVKDAGFNVFELIEKFFIFLRNFAIVISIAKRFSHRSLQQDCQAAFIFPKLIFLESFAVLVVSIRVLEMSLSNLDDFDQWVNQPNVVYILFPDFPGHSLVQNEKVKKLIQRGINIVSGFLSDN